MSSTRDSLVAGCVAGAVSRLATSPLDVVKIRWQLQDGPRTHSSLLRAVAVVVGQEGLRGLWKGNSPAMVLYLAYGGVQFAAFHRLRPHTDVFAAAAVSGAIATAATYPLDALRTRMAADSANAGLRAAVQAVRRDGVFALYRGLAPSILQVMPVMGLTFETHRLLSERWPQHASSLHRNLVCGALAGAFSKAVCMPFDVVRKRLQVSGNGNSRAIACALGIIRRDGVKGLYRGMKPSVLKAAISAGVTFFCYDAVMAHLKE